ncbi:MAG TPA: lipoate--protein ligase family protein [Aliicoccus persicus]|uniref:Lipoate--protein ligase family protein n=1 Tax=Aliicoccus persicus TaxID=930138 RepID=A0A921B4R4_9STAP|nr:lipoate--protein ligase family protein [Aliicoccus persicus]
MQREKWLYLNSGKQDAFYNMAVDELLMEKHRNGEIPPVIRLYEWQVPSLSLGYFQKVKKEIDIDMVEEYGYQMVRRLTGGRGVLHDKELTYSIVVSEAHPRMPHSVSESYRIISSGLLEGFKNLGLDAYFSVPDTEEKRKSLTNVRSSVCFDTPSWYELVVEGKKIAGSAQTRQDGVIMQHGSILLDVDVDHLFDMFNYTNQRFKEKMKSQFKEVAVAINDISNQKFTVEDLYPAFKLGFEKGLEIETEPLVLTENDHERIKVLMEKYKSEEWMYRK